MRCRAGGGKALDGAAGVEVDRDAAALQRLLDAVEPALDVVGDPRHLFAEGRALAHQRGDQGAEECGQRHHQHPVHGQDGQPPAAPQRLQPLQRVNQRGHEHGDDRGEDEEQQHPEHAVNKELGLAVDLDQGQDDGDEEQEPGRAMQVAPAQRVLAAVLAPAAGPPAVARAPVLGSG